MKKYRTRSLAEAAALLVDPNVETKFDSLEPTDQHNKFKFVIAINSEDEVFNQWVNNYINNETTVKPKEYDAALNMLRDRLSLAKN